MKTDPSNGVGGISTQVGGYVWKVTFVSNVWRDPTEDHNVSFIPGNWYGTLTTFSHIGFF